MSRPQVETIHVLDVPEEELTEGPLAGTRRRMLSEDDSDGSFTAFVSLPAGFKSEPAPGRPFEVFVLEGQVTIGGETVGTGIYAYAPGAASERMLGSVAGAQILLFVDPERFDGNRVEVVDPDQKPWQNVTAAGEVSKWLRVDDDIRATAALGAMAPGTGEPRSEVHDGTAEYFVLRGDIIYNRKDGSPAEATPGSYIWRDSRIRHLPKFSRNGALIFYRFKGVEWDCDVSYDEVPSWPSKVAAYVARQPFFRLERPR